MPKMKKINLESQRSKCPISCYLEILGDKWSLIIVRDLLERSKKYSELLEGTENIPSNILADRLKKLQKHNIVQKEAYETRPLRYKYSLSESGIELWPILKEAIIWGDKHIKNTSITPKIKAYLT